jgi:hypothetical protein
MTNVRAVLVSAVAVIVLGAQIVVAQDLSRYRGFTLGSSVASVVATSGARASDAKTSYGEPAKIQELEWRVWLSESRGELADPVHAVLFSFADDRLYQIVVTYDRNRTEGLTNDDVIESVSATYGVPPLLQGRAAGSVLPAAITTETVVVARWEDADSLLVLTRGTYPPTFQLTLISKTLNAGARDAIREALRLDAQTAPQRELDRRNKNVSDAQVASQKARAANKPAFRP